MAAKWNSRRVFTLRFTGLCDKSDENVYCLALIEYLDTRKGIRINNKRWEWAQHLIRRRKFIVENLIQLLSKHVTRHWKEPILGLMLVWLDLNLFKIIHRVAVNTWSLSYKTLEVNSFFFLWRLDRLHRSPASSMVESSLLGSVTASSSWIIWKVVCYPRQVNLPIDCLVFFEVVLLWWYAGAKCFFQI